MHCCEDMKRQVKPNCSANHGDTPCPDHLVSFNEVFNEYGLIIHDGGTSTVGISFCPWCGTKLPESQRDEWFDHLELLGYDDPLSQPIPSDFRTSAWRLKGN